MEAKAITLMLPDTLIERDKDANEATLVAVKVAALVDRLAYKLQQAKAKTLGHALAESES